jgi:GT2 family glycosyltransferase
MQTYTKNSKFYIKKIESKTWSKTYFIHENGQHIRTDELGALIWKTCNSSNFSQVKKRLGEKLNCPHDLLKSYLSLLATAGIIKNEDKNHSKIVRKQEKNTPIDDLVSIVVINFNGEKFIADCLSSLRKQTHKNKEVIVWDNNSLDNSLKTIGEEFPEVKVIKSKKNILFAKAVSLSIEKCKGDYLVILNPDTVLDRSFIHELLAMAKASKKAAAVVPKMMLYSLPKCINGIGNYVPPWKWGSDNFIGHFDLGQLDSLKEVPSACFGAVMLKKKALEDIGPIDNRYQAYYEDADWSYRARLKGWKIVPAPRAVIYHKFETSFKDFPGLKSKLVVRNRLRFVIKIFAFYHLKGFLKNYLKEDLRHFVYFFKTFNLKMLKIYLLSYFSLLFQFPELLLARAKIQKSRNEDISDRDILNLAPHYPPLLDEDSAPILSVESIRNIYFWELNKK